MKMLEGEYPDMIVDWPPSSPDLNLIENLWTILTENVHQVDCKSVRALKQRVRLCWRTMIKADVLRALVADMSNRTGAARDRGPGRGLRSLNRFSY